METAQAEAPEVRAKEVEKRDLIEAIAKKLNRESSSYLRKYGDLLEERYRTQGVRIHVRVGMVAEGMGEDECRTGVVETVEPWGCVIRDEDGAYVSEWRHVAIQAMLPEDCTETSRTNSYDSSKVATNINNEMNCKLSRLEVEIEDWADHLEKLEDMLAASVETILHYDTGSGSKASRITECEITAIDYTMVTVRKRLARMRKAMMESAVEQTSPAHTDQSKDGATCQSDEIVSDESSQDNDDTKQDMRGFAEHLRDALTEEIDADQDNGEPRQVIASEGMLAYGKEPVSAKSIMCVIQRVTPEGCIVKPTPCDNMKEDEFLLRWGDVFARVYELDE